MTEDALASVRTGSTRLPADLMQIGGGESDQSGSSYGERVRASQDEEEREPERAEPKEGDRRSQQSAPPFDAAPSYRSGSAAASAPPPGGAKPPPPPFEEAPSVFDKSGSTSDSNPHVVTSARDLSGSSSPARPPDIHDEKTPTSEPTVVRPYMSDEEALARTFDIRLGHRTDELELLELDDISIDPMEIDFADLEDEATHELSAELAEAQLKLSNSGDVAAPTAAPPPRAEAAPAPTRRHIIEEPESIPDWPDIDPLPPATSEPAPVASNAVAQDTNGAPSKEVAAPAAATPLHDAADADRSSGAPGVDRPASGARAADAAPGTAGREIDDDAKPAERSPEEEPAPISVRQPKELRTLDEAFADLDAPSEGDDRPPESGEVASQRKPTIPAAAQQPREWEDEPTSDGEGLMALTRAPSQPAPHAREIALDIVAETGPAPSPIEVRATVIRPAPLSGDAAAFVGAVRSLRPQSFGELLDASLTLGEREP